MNKEFFLLITLLGLGLASCQKTLPDLGRNYVDQSNPNINQTIGDTGAPFRVVGKEALKNFESASSERGKELLNQIAEVRVNIPVTASLTSENTLYLGYPKSLLNEYQVFGGVITKVTDKTNEKMGGLKLSDLPPILVKAKVAKSTDGKEFALVLFGCLEKCSEISEQKPILGIPIVGVDPNQIILDLSSLGKELNLLDMLDPNGDFTELKTVESKVTVLDFSLSTLVFDVEVRMVPKNNDTVLPTIFTVRWYLKLTSTFNSAFESRSAHKEVGYFLTERSVTPHIQRFSMFRVSGESDDQAVHYFIKNVPEKFQPSFKASFDGWNDRFKTITGSKLLSYDFVAQDSPISKFLVAGDARYNILEWDMDNAAPYGGLGPSMANQFTGQIFSANVLIQGPHIILLYSKWFKVSERANALRQEGNEEAAEQLIVDFRRSRHEPSPTHLEVRLRNLDFRIASQSPSLHDPLAQRDDFEMVPNDQTFETYMSGYFQDMVSHELGHNIGLRHNFTGNLRSQNPLQVGTVSDSVMEYLGRRFRYLDRIGEYDAMALRYGYRGVTPEVSGHFCTDEDVPSLNTPNGSAECSRDDATSDPFGYFQNQLKRAIRLLTASESTAAPVWTALDMNKELETAFTGLALYALTASTTGAGWKNFFTGGDRPKNIAEVKAYVVQMIGKQLCDPTLTSVIAQKASEEAKQKTIANLTDLRKKATELLTPVGVGSAQEYCD